MTAIAKPPDPNRQPIINNPSAPPGNPRPTDRNAQPITPSLYAQFREILREAKGAVFFDGMNSPLAEKTGRIIALNGDCAVEALKRILDKRQNEIESVEEILRQVGLLQDETTRRQRLNLLTGILASREARIRDAASLGLSFMEDPTALSALCAARQAETENWVRTNLSLAIEQLEHDIQERTHPPMPSW